MKKSYTAKSTFSRLLHVGVVVRDLEKAIKHLESLGIGPFDPPYDTLATKERLLRGSPVTVKLRQAVAHMGPVQLELTMPIEGGHPYEEYLNKYGEGLNHICVAVDDVDKEITRLGDLGLKPVMTAKFVSGDYNAIYETGIGGFTIELLQPQCLD